MKIIRTSRKKKKTKELKKKQGYDQRQREVSWIITDSAPGKNKNKNQTEKEKS